MKQIQFLLLLLPLLLVAGMASAQKREITGKVTDQATGLPLAGVSVVAGKEKVGTSTKDDGTFIISVGPGIKTLEFSSISYAPQTVNIEGKSSFDITLVSEATIQSEVVVIGYGSQKKSSVTGAVSKFRSERLDEAPVARLDQALQGKIAGVTIQNVGSEAGTAPKVRVRGLSSVNAGASPLVVVDGHPVPDGLSFVNAADVESIEVLKDAASAAIYGSRGASGVILITTKSGKSAKPKYNVKMSTGTKSAYKLYDTMTATEWLYLLLNEGFLKSTDPSVPANQLTTLGIAGAEDRAGYIIENQLRGGKSTNWQEEAIRNANVKNFQISVSGGSKEVKYYISGGYQNDQGMMINSEYERFSIRSKIDAQLSKRVKV